MSATATLNEAATFVAGLKKKGATNDLIRDVLARNNYPFALEQVMAHEIANLDVFEPEIKTGTKAATTPKKSKAPAIIAAKNEVASPVGSAANAGATPSVPEEYEAPPSSILSYPNMGDDLISQWSREVTQGTGIPFGHVRENLKNVLAFLLEDRVKFPLQEKFFIRGWHFNLGEPETSKTLALSTVWDWWGEDLDAAGIYRDKLSSYGSAQFLVKGFQDHPRMFLYVTEGNTLATANENVPAIFGSLADLYDTRIITAGSFKNKVSCCDNAEGSAIICFTPTDFTKALQSKGVIGGGTLPRWTLSYSEKIVVDGDWAIPSEARLKELHDKILDRIQVPEFEFVGVDESPNIFLKESPEAKEIRLGLTREMHAEGKYGLRLIEHYKRENMLSAVFSAANDRIITRDIAAHAAEWTRYQLQLRQVFYPSDGGDKVEIMAHAIIKLVQKAYPQAVSFKQIKDVTHVYREGSGGFETLNRAMYSLKLARVIKPAGENKKGMALFLWIPQE